MIYHSPGVSLPSKILIAFAHSSFRINRQKFYSITDRLLPKLAAFFNDGKFTTNYVGKQMKQGIHLSIYIFKDKNKKSIFLKTFFL